MSPLAVWLRTHRVVWAAALALVLVTAAVTTALATGHRQPTAAAPTATVAPVSTAAPSTAPSATPNPDTSAVDAARGFAVAWMSYRWDDTPQTLAARVRPYVSDRLYANFAAGGDAAGLTARRAAAHEQATAAVTGVYLEGPTPDGHIGMVVTCAVTVTSDSGTTTSTRSVEVFTRDGRVDGVTA